MASKENDDQVRADKLAETPDETAKKATAKAAKADEPADQEPSPSQAELDAIKKGEYRNRALTSK